MFSLNISQTTRNEQNSYLQIFVLQPVMEPDIVAFYL